MVCRESFVLLSKAHQRDFDPIILRVTPLRVVGGTGWLSPIARSKAGRQSCFLSSP
jgi:hypothetical protein